MRKNSASLYGFSYCGMNPSSKNTFFHILLITFLLFPYLHNCANAGCQKKVYVCKHPLDMYIQGKHAGVVSEAWN